MNNIIKNASVLFIISLVAGLSLALVFTITEEPIKEQNIKIQNESMRTLISDADDFKLDESYTLPNDIKAVFTAFSGDSIVGYVVSSSSMGYGGPVDVFTAFDTNANIINIDIVGHAETPGLGALADGDDFKNNFKGLTAPLSVVKGLPSTDAEIEAITSSTITTKAVVDAVNLSSDFINSYLTSVVSNSFDSLIKIIVKEVSNG